MYTKIQLLEKLIEQQRSKFTINADLCKRNAMFHASIPKAAVQTLNDLTSLCSAKQRLKQRCEACHCPFGFVPCSGLGSPQAAGVM